MAEETESEEMGRLVSAAVPPTDVRSSLPPRKRVRASLDQSGRASPGSSSSASSVRFRNPNLSSCHVCGSRISSNRGKDKLQTLDSQWRIVLLCNNCFYGVQSAKDCSYCFTEISEAGVSCACCDRRIHGGCVSKYPRFGLCSKSGSYTCIDCWAPKSVNGVSWSINLNGSSKIVRGTCSVKISRASSDVGGCSRSLEDAVKDANSSSEKKIAAASRAGERALTKAMVARKAAEMAKNPLDLAAAAAAAREENQVKDSQFSSDSVADDTKLAFMLHRTINSSPRISKNLCSMDSHLFGPKLQKGNGYLLDKQSDSGSDSVHGELEVCTDNVMLENPDKAVSEPSVRIGSSDNGSSIDLSVMEPRMKVDTRESPHVKDCKENGEDAFMGNFERGLEASLVRLTDCNDGIVELPEKELASISFKVTNSIGSDIDYGSQCYQKQEDLEHKLSSNSRGNQCQSPCNKDSSTKKRCGGPDMYLRKYSKRCTSLKENLDRSSPPIMEFKENGKDGVMGNFESGLRASLIRMSDCNDGIVKLPAKEKMSSSIKVSDSSGNDIDTGSQCYQKQEGLEHKVSSNSGGTLCKSACDEDSSIMERKRCHGPDMYFRKYSKRHTSSKEILDQKTMFLYEDSPLETQASTPGLPFLQLNSSKVCRTFSDPSFQSPSVALEVSAHQSGPSGQQS